MTSNDILEPSDYWGRCQLFRPMQLQIGVSSDRNVSFAQLLALLREFGAEVTISSNRNIQITEGAAITLLTQHLSAHIKDMIGKGIFRPLSFDNFLANGSGSLATGVWSKNGKVVKDCVWAYLFETRNDYIRSILCPTTIPNYHEWRQKCKDTTEGILVKHTTCVTNSSRGKATINKKWSYCLVFLQAAVTDPGILELMPRLFEMPQPEIEQRAPIDAYASYFSSPKWVQTFMNPVIEATRRMVVSYLTIEDRLIKLVRTKTCSSNKDRMRYLRTLNFEGWDEITKYTHGIGKGFQVFDYKLYNLMDTAGELYGEVGNRSDNRSEIVNRLKALIVAGAVTDLIKSVLKYGPNPKLRFDFEPDSNEAKNNLVKKYLE